MSKMIFSKTLDTYIKGYGGQMVKAVIYCANVYELMFHFRADVVVPDSVNVDRSTNEAELVQSVYKAVAETSKTVCVENCPICSKPMFIGSTSMYCTNIQCSITGNDGLYRQSCVFSIDEMEELEHAGVKYIEQYGTVPSSIFDVMFFVLESPVISYEFKNMVVQRLKQMTLSTFVQLQGIPNGINEEAVNDVFVDIADIYIVLKTSVVTTGITSLIGISTTDTNVAQFLITLVLNNVDVLTKIALIVADERIV